ncbi:MAG: hypothetical protein LBD71_02130 [Treponema sp.]|nr:hypothetical protein [Treponema sp.]
MYSFHSDPGRAGQFYRSGEKLRRPYEIIPRSRLSRPAGLPVDCPRRDERLPWPGNARSCIRFFPRLCSKVCIWTNILSFFPKETSRKYPDGCP